MYSHTKQYGFTLAELLIVIAIFVILASFAVPSYQQMVQNSMIRNAASSIQSGLQIARGEAVKRNANVQLELGAGNSSSWNVCPQPSPAGACTVAAIIQTRATGDGSSSDVTATPDNAGPFVFNGMGMLVSPASTVQIAVDNGALSASDSRDLNIIIDVGGSSKVCDPALNGSADVRKCS